VNAVAHEARVKVTGARPADAGSERDLFTESTTTVLVFEKGAVILLTAAVAPGQLLFLTNEETRREVVAQVTRKRTRRPTDCYVELEFTEPAPKFWGMEFSAATALLPKDAKEAEAAALVASAETTADEPAQPAPSASSDQVMALKQEVEALRKQLNSLQTQGAAPESNLAVTPVETASVPAQAEPAPTETPLALVGDPVVVPNHEQIVAPSVFVEPEPVVPFAAQSPPFDSERHPAELTPPEQVTLPKPALDFSMSLPKRKKKSFRARGNFTPGFRSGMLRVIILGAVLVVTIIGAAWYKDWLPWKRTSKKIEVSSWAVPMTTAAASTNTGEEAPGTATVQPANGRAGTEAQPEVSPGENVRISNPTHVGSVAPSAPTAQPGGRTRPTTLTATAKSSSARTKATPSGDSAAVSPDAGTLVPPKLIQAAQAVASLDDLRDFETGSVIIDAVVDTTGSVSSMSVLSGPPSLREPAMRALRNYRYEPATQNGKPIATHVKVKIQFHFE
jgi:protein TonB